jgi:aminocarboxymuconate-semialdehyde decarboxylase
VTLESLQFHIETGGADMIIDVHAHYFPAIYLDALDRCGSKATGICRDVWAGDSAGDVAARLEMMDAAGVDMQILSATAAPPYFHEAGNAVSTARLANDLYAEFVSSYSERFLALATLPLPHVQESIGELSRALDDLGMVGVSIASSVLGRSLADPLFEPLYDELDRRGAVVLVHPAGDSAGSGLIADYHVTWMLGAPVEDTLAALHLILRGVLFRYPSIRFIICHLGGALPMLLPRFDRQALWEMPDAPETPSAGARRLWYETTAHGHVPALRIAAETLGADRLLLGSDYPYQRDEWYTRSVTYVRESGLPSKEVNAVLGGTASALFSLPDTCTSRSRTSPA